MRGQKKTLPELKRGDIINLPIPFEENSRDYYNGYRPEDIRGKQFTDRFGNRGKSRMVVYLGHDKGNLLYLPLTSQHSGYDSLHQYQLKDNSMTPKRHENMKSFVEIDSLRAIHIRHGREIDYTGRLAKEDLNNIMHRMTNNTLQFDSKRDQRGIVPKDAVSTWERELNYQGYKPSSNDGYRTMYTKDDSHTISRTKFGMVYYHVELTREEVHDMVSKREGKELPTLPDINHAKAITPNRNPHADNTLDFSKTVDDISAQVTNKQER